MLTSSSASFASGLAPRLALKTEVGRESNLPSPLFASPKRERKTQKSLRSSSKKSPSKQSPKTKIEIQTQESHQRTPWATGPLKWNFKYFQI